MKIFLFLYPVSWYLERMASRCNDDTIARFNAMILARYRERGYRIVWVVFGRDENPAMIDRELIDPRFERKADDLTISCGVSLAVHQTEVYPESAHIIAQLGHCDEIVLAGFHLMDCVDRVARYVHDRGVPMRVDEDLTDQGLMYSAIGYALPLRRDEKRAPQEFREFLRTVHDRMPFHDSAETLIALHQEDREGRPWLMQLV